MASVPVRKVASVLARWGYISGDEVKGLVSGEKTVKQITDWRRGYQAAFRIGKMLRGLGEAIPA